MNIDLEDLTARSILFVGAALTETIDVIDSWIEKGVDVEQNTRDRERLQAELYKLHEQFADIADGIEDFRRADTEYLRSIRPRKENLGKCRGIICPARNK